MYYSWIEVKPIKMNENKLTEQISRIQKMMGLLESVSDSSENLQLGSVGENVEDLQKILNIYKDGIFGPQTEKCVQDFQRKVKIEDDGIVGPITKQYIKKIEDGTLVWDSPEYCKSKKYGKTITTEPKNRTDDNSISSESSDVVIFMAGIEKMKSKESQAKILQNALGDKKVILHAWTDLSGVENSIKKYPNANVILFSKACDFSSIIANIINKKNKLFIVEPYAKGGNNSVVNAVNIGVPNSNVIVAPNSSARGTGVVKGARINNLGDHFDALRFVANLIK